MAYSTLDQDVQFSFQTIVDHVEEQNAQITELQLRLEDANSQMTEINHKTSLDVARLLDEERTSAEAERHQFLTEISTFYDRSFQQRWDRLTGNYGIICSDISSSGDLMQDLTTHSQIGEYIAKQKHLAGEIADLRSSLKARMAQNKTVSFSHLIRSSLTQSRPLMNITFLPDKQQSPRRKTFKRTSTNTMEDTTNKQTSGPSNWIRRNYRTTS